MGLLDAPPHWLPSITRSFQNSGPTGEDGSYEYATGSAPRTAGVSISISIIVVIRTAARVRPVRGDDTGFFFAAMAIVECVGWI
jgi:hypothetical protein